MSQPGLPRNKVFAAIVRLLEKSLIRIGNEEYVKQNRSFGLTTLRNHHVRVNGGTLRFQFRGKSGVRHSVDVNDRHLAQVVRQCRDLPGQELFQYIDESGELQPIDSGDINAYLKDVTGEDFTAKDFRTWWGTVLAVAALRDTAANTRAEAEKNVVLAIEAVAKQLGNTRTVCRKSYVHPGLIDCYLDGEMERVLGRRGRVFQKNNSRLRSDEVAVVLLLRHLQMRAPARRKAA
jgi:DNA topoisomerase-1